MTTYLFFFSFSFRVRPSHIIVIAIIAIIRAWYHTVIVNFENCVMRHVVALTLYLFASVKILDSGTTYGTTRKLHHG